MKYYTTTLQTASSLPGDLVPPGGYGWQLHSMMERSDGIMVVAWFREMMPCPDCQCLMPSCQCRGTHGLNCPRCNNTGRVPKDFS